jgi:hypothetical protein
MPVLERQRAMQERVIRFFGDGGTVVVRRRHTLKSQRQGKPTNQLVVNGGFSAGAAAISLRADLLQGKLWKGCKVTIAGTEYTVGVDVEAAGGALAGVSISPVLAGNVSDGTAATVTGTFVDYTFVASRGSIDVDNLDTGERQKRSVLHLVATGGASTPEPGDEIVDGAEVQRIARVTPVNPGGGAARFDVVLGGGG